MSAPSGGMRRLHHTSIWRGAGKAFVRASVMVLPHCVHLTVRDYLDKHGVELNLTPERAVEIGERLVWLGKTARVLLDESNAAFAASWLASSEHGASESTTPAGEEDAR